MKLGVLFNFRSVWMGGVIYIINLINALNHLDEEEKPEVYLFYSKELKKFLDEIKYPYIQLIELKPIPVAKGYLTSWIKRKNIFVDDLISEYDLNAIYPVRDFPVKNKTNAKVISWYADLQHRFYPEFFSKGTLIHRAIRLFFILRNSYDLVVSSQAVKDDFFQLYKIRKDLNINIYHFVSINEGFDHLNIKDLKEKYNLPDNYYMISNQFHKHKNHKVLLLAMAKLKESGVKIHMAMTGKLRSAINTPYIEELNSIIDKYDLHDQISFLGIIPRDEQMQLMNYCQAVLQPSLFEGWSTVIEDAISIQVPVVASNLKVNIEQLKENGKYFDPHNADELANILKDYPVRDMNKKPYPDYDQRIKEALKILLEIFKGNN